MIPPDVMSYLQYPLYKLHYIDDIETFDGLSSEEVAAIRSEYSSEIIEGIVAALQWVAAHPDADLTSVMPDLTHDNRDIHRFVALALGTLKP